CAVHCLAFIDNKTLVSSGEDRCVRRWDVITGKEREVQKVHEEYFLHLQAEVPYLVVPQNGKNLLYWLPLGERGSQLRAVDLTTDERLLAPVIDGTNKEPRHVVAVSFSADGKRAATAGKDGKVRLFDLAKKGDRIGDDWMIFDKGVDLGDLAL